MQLIYKNIVASYTIRKAIEAITNAAVLNVNEVQLDKSNNRAILPIKRRQVTENIDDLESIKRKRSIIDIFNSIFCRKHFGKTDIVMIDSIVTINNITEFEVADNIDKYTEDPLAKEIHLLFGIGFRGKNIFLSSAEDVHGEVFYSLDLKVKEIDIEIRDVE